MFKKRHSSIKDEQPLSNKSPCKDQQEDDEKLIVPKQRQDNQQNSNKQSSSIKRYFSDGSTIEGNKAGSRLNLKRRVSLFKRSFSITNPFQNSSSSKNQLASPSIHIKNLDSTKTLQNDDDDDDDDDQVDDRSHFNNAATTDRPLLLGPRHNNQHSSNNKEHYGDPANPPTPVTKNSSSNNAFISTTFPFSHTQHPSKTNVNYPPTPDVSVNLSPIKEPPQCSSQSQHQSAETLIQPYTPDSSSASSSSATNSSIRIASASTSSTGLQYRRQQRSISNRKKLKQKTTANGSAFADNCMSLAQNNDPETPTRPRRPEFSIFGVPNTSQNSSVSNFSQQTSSSTLFSSPSSYQWPGPWTFPPGKNVTPIHLKQKEEEEETSADSSSATNSTISSIVSKPTIKLVDAYNNNASNSNTSLLLKPNNTQNASLTCNNLEDDVDGLKITESRKNVLSSISLSTTNYVSSNETSTTAKVHPLLIPEIVSLVIRHVDAMSPIPKEAPPRRRKPMSLRHAMLLYGNKEEALRAWQESRAAQPEDAETKRQHSSVEYPLDETDPYKLDKQDTGPRNMMACLLVNRLWYKEAISILYSSIHFSNADNWSKFVNSNMFKSRHNFLKKTILNAANGDSATSNGTQLQRVGPFDISNPRLSFFQNSSDPKPLDLHAKLEVPNQAWSPKTLILHKIANASPKELLDSLPPWSTRNLEWIEFYTCFQLVPTLHLVAGGMLKKIALPGCPRVSDSTVYMIAAQCPLLEHLDLRACALVSDNSVIQIALKCPRLQLLNVGRTVANDRITSASVDYLAKCTQVTTLGLAGCHVDDWGIWQLVKYRGSHLQRLSLNNCILLTNASIPRILEYTPQLSVLEVRSVLGITDMVPFIMFKRWRERLGHPPPLIEGCEVFELRLREAEWTLELQITKRIFKDSLEWIYNDDDGDVDYYESPLYSLALAQAAQLDDNGERRQRLIRNRQSLLHKKMYWKRMLEEELNQEGEVEGEVEEEPESQEAEDGSFRMIHRQRGPQIIQRRNPASFI